MFRLLGILCILGTLLPGPSTAQVSRMPFEFIENKGQWNAAIKYKGEYSTGAFFLQDNGFTVLQHHPDDLQQFYESQHTDQNTNGNPQPISGSGRAGMTRGVLRSHSYRVQFVGARSEPEIVPEKKQLLYYNYLLGNDRSAWRSHVALYGAVTYKNIYPNIDVRYYSDQGQLKYDLLVHPGGRVEQIALQYTGADRISVNRQKELVIATSAGEVRELYPYSYQYDDQSVKKELRCRYRIENGNTVKFDLKDYDPRYTLIIDPTVVFCTYTGGPNNYGFTATPGPGGTMYTGSIIFTSGFTTLPVTPGAFQRNFNGGASSNLPTDMLIMKFDAGGEKAEFATYLGGNLNDFPHSLYSDPAGNLVIMGRSYSKDFPTRPANNVVGTSAENCDIVVAKLTADGTDMIGGVRIGGKNDDGVNISDLFMNGQYGRQSILQNYGDESRSEVVLDASQNIYVASCTRSTDFPVTGPSSALAGKQDGVLLKINPSCNTVLWSRYYGGSDDDGALVLEINPLSNNVYLAGATNSTDLPGTAAAVTNSFLKNSKHGDIDGYIASFDGSTGNLIKATYAGTDNVDVIYGIKFDRKGFPYIMGTTRGSNNWPLVNASPIGSSSTSSGRQFVAKLRSDLNGVVFSTVFGPGGFRPNMSPVAFLVDRCENMYVSGWGGWIDSRSDPFDQGNVTGMPITPDAFKRTTDARDFYFIVIKKNASDLLYGTYYGQDGGEGEHVDGGTSRYDQEGVIYQGICANCGGNSINPLPIFSGGATGRPWSKYNGAASTGGCNLAALKIAFNFAGVGGGLQSEIEGKLRNYGCVPLTVDFFDSTYKRSKSSWEWTIYGGATTGSGVLNQQITRDSTYRYTFPPSITSGNYLVRLVVTDSNTCNVTDTTYLTIRARDSRATLSIGPPVKVGSCESSNTYVYSNNSVVPAGYTFSGTSFTWDFGDQSALVVSGNQAQTHTFPGPGTYFVSLTLTDTSYCNAPQTIIDTLRVATNLVARFESPTDACLQQPITFDNTSSGGQRFTWTISKAGTLVYTSNSNSLSYTFTDTGVYSILLDAFDLNTCNPTDDTTATITIHGNPIADFDFSPKITPAKPNLPPNTPTSFYNYSKDAVRYVWDFGDGTPVVETTSLDSIQHEYLRNGRYRVCLTAYNAYGCSDDTCQLVESQVIPAVDVPNAFTPGRGGINSVIKVKGFGIERMKWVIYNRWGQIVFESSQKDNGWDGTYQGKLQPMDVYTYILEVQFSDATKARKLGDITLIR